jgi:predicted Zn-dependent protease
VARPIRPRFLVVLAAAVVGLAALLTFQLATAPAVLRERGVYLVPLGDFSPETLDGLATHFERRYGLNADVVDAVDLEEGAIDEHRGQYVAEDLVRLVWEAYRKELATRAIVVGVTSEDMYMRGYPEWRYVFGYRWADGGYAVVSTARINPVNYGEPPDEALLAERLRKVTAKQIGVLYFGLAVSDDPTSVLYTPLSVDDLDRMGEDLPTPAAAS